MKSRVLMIMIMAVLMTGCSTKIKDDTLPNVESGSSGAYEEEFIGEKEEKEQLIEEMTDDAQEELNSEQKDETVQDELISEEMAGEEQEDNALPVFMEFDELCFMQLYMDKPYYYMVFYLYADGTFNGEIRHARPEDNPNWTYNRFSGRFEIEKKVGDGVYLLKMPEIYLLYEPESKVKLDEEDDIWTADPVDSLVQGLYFYLCLAGADVNCLPSEYLEESYYPIPFAEDIFETNIIINRNINEGYGFSTEYFYTDAKGKFLYTAPDHTDTVTGKNRKKILAISSAYNDFVEIGFANYIQVEDGPDTFVECTHLSTYYEDPYYLDFLDVYNCSMEDIEIEEILVEILEYIPLDEMDYYVLTAPGGDAGFIEERGLFVELDPLVENVTPATQADLYYVWEDGYPEIIPTFEKYEQTLIRRGNRILYMVGVVPKQLGYYRYCFHIDYISDGNRKRVSTEPMNLLKTDLTPIKMEELMGKLYKLMEADSLYTGQ